MPDATGVITLVLLLIVSAVIALFIDRFYKTRVRQGNVNKQPSKK